MENKHNIYGLTNVYRSCYLSVKIKLLSLGVYVSKLDRSVFIWHKDNLEGMICAHVDDFLFSGSQLFIKNIVEPLVQTFTKGTHYSKAFKYLGLNLNQNDNPWNSWFSTSANNCRCESVYLVVMSAILNIKLANIFLSQIDFIKVLTGDVVLVNTLVNPEDKLNLTSHFLWAVSK